ncbi:MAG: lipid-binding SYLF domain-containing protein [Acetobacteraceae bacterium]
MKRLALFCLLLAAAFALAAPPAQAQARQQALVDRATLTLQDIMTGPHGADGVALLKAARAVMICPRIFKAGFILGGSGGDCVLVARAGGGSWSDPAFFTIGSGSIGLQAGIQDSEVVLIIRTERGLNALLNSHFKVGADASVAIATIGGGVQRSMAAPFQADIVAISSTRGLFAGVALDGSVLSSDPGWNQSYYGTALSTRQIIIAMKANNPGANPLRAMLSRFGG